MRKKIAKDFSRIPHQYHDKALVKKHMLEYGIHVYRREFLLQWDKDNSSNMFSQDDISEHDKRGGPHNEKN